MRQKQTNAHPKTIKHSEQTKNMEHKSNINTRRTINSDNTTTSILFYLKLVICLKNLPYVERLKQLKLPTLKYRRLRGDMIEVSKIVHNYYDPGASVKFKSNPFGITRGNKFKLQKFTCHYNLRKYSFCSRVINIWNSLPDHVVEADSINKFKSRLDKYWTNQDIVYNYDCDLTGTGR